MKTYSSPNCASSFCLLTAGIAALNAHVGEGFDPIPVYLPKDFGRFTVRAGFRFLAMLLLVIVGVSAFAQTRTPVTESEHNLSTGSNSGRDACSYCHAPHHVAPIKGLWNHEITKSDYTSTYNTTTYRQGAEALAPASPSRLCLSCHDGTVAIGMLYNSTSPTPTGRTLVSNLGTNLKTDHPFSFDTWTRDKTLRDELFANTPRTTADAKVKLRSGRIECTTCHEPHTPNLDPKRSSKFLVASNANGNLCLACHDITKPSPNILSGWSASAHVRSLSTENATSVTGYSSIAEGGCMNCHTSHGAGSDRLLKSGEANACLPCHANVSSTSRWAQTWVGHDDATKYMHPVGQKVHQPGEDLNLPATVRHAECWDCHDAHAMRQSTPTVAPSIQSSLSQATGVDKDSKPLSAAANEYEVCFKCHGDTPNKPQSQLGYQKFGHTPRRQVDATNTRLDFNTQFSRHNVVLNNSGRRTLASRDTMRMQDGSTGRSLAAQNIYCTDCHNHDNAQSGGGTGSNGPHVSAFQHLLARRNDMNEPPTSGLDAVSSLTISPDGGDPLTGPFALCNKCHEVSLLLSATGDSVFKHHASHVVGAGISCAVCHAPHGVQDGIAGEDAGHHGGLVNLDKTMIMNGSTASIDTLGKSCTVQCHFSNKAPVNHVAVSYR